jgi:hypothetical protein
MSRYYFLLNILLFLFGACLALPSQVQAINFSDTFARTQSNGWGTSDSGSTYTIGGGTASDYSVNGTKGIIIQNSVNTNRTVRLGSINETDTDMKVKISLDKKPLTNTQHLYLIARRNSGNNSEYFGHVLWLTNNKVYVNLQVNNANVFSDLTSNIAIPDMLQEVNKDFWVRYQVSGTNPTTLKIKVWYDGWKEPTYWHSEITDSTANVQGPGSVGLRGYLGSTVSNAPITLSFDNFTITDPTPAPTPPAIAGTVDNKGVAWHIGEWYNTSNAPSSYYFTGIYSDLDKMKAAGIKWVRFTIDISTQTTCGDDTKFYARIRDALKARGMQGLARIAIPNALTTTATTEERAAFVTWAQTMVNCYKDDFTYWELGNENNLAAFWNIDDADGSDPVAYAQSVNWYYQYLEDFHTTVKAIDPSLQVVHGGLSQHHLTRWLDEMALINPSAYFDIMSFHPYSDLGADGTVNQVNILYAKMQTISGMESKPIWITEVGYTADPLEYPGNTGGSESLKATYLSDVYQKLLDWGVEGPIFWYDFAQSASAGSSMYELTFADRSAVTYTDRLAYTAMQNVWSSSITAPTNTISSVSVIPTDTTAAITWNTSYIRSTQVEYGTTASYGISTPITNISPMTKSHAVTLSDLQSCTTYHYRVKNADTLGSQTVSADAEFKTTGCPSASATPTSTTGSTSTTTATDSSVCKDTVGDTAPWMYGAVAQDAHSILLYFTQASDPTDNYAVKYGTNSGDYMYGADKLAIKAESRMTYLVKGLEPNTTYYFKVRGGNGCMPGNWSNEIKATTQPNISYSNLQFSKMELEAIPTTDTKQNEAQQEVAGYTVKVTVLNQQDQPVAGAKVTLHSKVQEAITDSAGLAVFKNVEKGDHQVIIAYNGFEGEQALNLTGDVTEFALEIKVKEQNVVLSPVYIWTVAILGTVILICGYMLHARKAYSTKFR